MTPLITEMPLKMISDQRGCLYISEFNQNLPFIVKRIYYICGVEDTNIVRGHHAHKKLKQLFICVSGSCKLTFDNGKVRQEVILDNPGKSIYVDSPIWREMSNFTKDAVLIILASEPYDEADYIRDYAEFLEYIRR